MNARSWRGSARNACHRCGTGQARVCDPVIKNLSPALIEGPSLAYLTVRRLDGPEARLELDANGHGPDGPALADRLRGHILIRKAALAGVANHIAKMQVRDLTSPKRSD